MKVINFLFLKKQHQDQNLKGVFWIEWDDIIEYFTFIYLSWNPAIYPYRKVFNSKFMKGPSDSKTWNEKYSLEYNPQFLIKIPSHDEDFEAT